MFTNCNLIQTRDGLMFRNFPHNRSLKQSSEDQSSAEYRRILDMLISDAMEVLDEPEWPAAEVVIRVLSTILV
jgi:hypothetical protein